VTSVGGSSAYYSLKASAAVFLSTPSVGSVWHLEE
jgi:hypothetical protein